MDGSGRDFGSALPWNSALAEAVPEDCRCLSGLRHDRCCGLDWRVAWEGRDAGRELDQAREALKSGALEAATAKLVDFLNLRPLDLEALGLLQQIRAEQGRPRASEALLKRLVRLNPNNIAATQALALLLFNRRALQEAEIHARNAVRMTPSDAQSHNLLGMIMTEAHRPHLGEYHYRRAIELLAKPSSILLANLAWNLKNQGRMEEARDLYRQSVALDPNIFQTLFGWAQMEETDRNFEESERLLDAAEALSPENQPLQLQRAILFERRKRYPEAIAILETKAAKAGALGPMGWSQKGALLDKMGRYGDAFAAFVEGKQTLRRMTGQDYRDADAQALVRRLKFFFRAPRLSTLPRAKTRIDVAQPIFIVGFPRSGTTMIEQTLTSHPQISAGDELPLINDLAGLAPRLLASPLGYPDALSELWLADQREGLDNLRDYYLQRARQLGALRDGANWFTDKMPLNETHLGLIGLVFPTAPIIHVLRHPLDVVLSVFSKHLTHGFLCAYDLISIAKHYALIMDLVDHYLSEMPSLKYLRFRYEEVIDDQGARVRELFDFIGVDFDVQCLNFHENRRYARTASYAQVAEKLYGTSRFRYRNYLNELAPAIEILEPVIARLGYAI
jgi:tetratricopeptide (TPR) repeat protein